MSVVENIQHILLMSLASINGNMKIVSLIDNHAMPITSLRAEAGEYFREYTAFIIYKVMKYRKILIKYNAYLKRSCISQS